jgi:3-oxoacyl-[acyl-carrier protein] reductase
MSLARSILITGANGFLGQALARYFLEGDAGCHVFLGVRKARANAEALAAVHAGRVTVLTLDVTCAEDWAESMRLIEMSGTSFQVLIHNAGHHEDGLLANMTEGQWHGVLASNLHGVFLGCQAAQRQLMLCKMGRIINITSLSGVHPPAGQTNYAAAKAGVIGLTQSLAKETARLGITVNAVAPAHIEGATPADWSAEQVKAAKMQTPFRRFARAEEVAAAVFFLASAEASYITGTVIRMDGALV